MTREQKLALIIGFSLVLLVGVLVSDHLSGARAAHLADVGSALENSAPPEFVDPLPDETEPAPPVEQTLAVNEAEQAPARPTRVADNAASPSEAFLENLRRQFQNSTANAVPALKHDELPEPAVADPLIDDARPPAVQTYRIQDGDSLWAIADREYGDGTLAKKLAEFNVRNGRLRDADTIRVGASILLPEPRALGSTAPPKRTVARASTKARTYTVRKGDTLGEIAQRQLGTTRRVEELLSANARLIDDPDDIRVGMVLKLPSS